MSSATGYSREVVVGAADVVISVPIRWCSVSGSATTNTAVLYRSPVPIGGGSAVYCGSLRVVVILYAPPSGGKPVHSGGFKEVLFVLFVKSTWSPLRSDGRT